VNARNSLNVGHNALTASGDGPELASRGNKLVVEADRESRPMLNQDCHNAQALLVNEMRHALWHGIWTHLDALMQVISDYEQHSLEGQQKNSTNGVAYSYAAAALDDDA
jgi:hypothetical protein